MYYQFYENGFGVGPHDGIRTKRYKLIHFKYRSTYGNKGWELYDLDKDPNELNNIYGLPENEKLIKDLKAKLVSLKNKYKVLQF